MPVALIGGPRSWAMTRDSAGHRDYTIKFMIRCTPADGPANALQTPGLPLPGSWWLVGNDIDVWAWCTLEASVSPVLTNEPNTRFEVEQKFSTRPPTRWRCSEDQVTDPVLEPPKISGSFVRYTEEATQDRFGLPLVSSSWEQLRGPQVEFDTNRPQVRIEQNILVLNLPLLASMVDCVNVWPMWGLPARCIKLSEVNWELQYYGACYVYFKRSLVFDINYNTWDRQILDEGTKVLKGHWDKTTGAYILDAIGGQPPNPFNPNHFIRFQDRLGNPGHVILNGAGLPAEVLVAGSYYAISVSIVNGGTNYSVGDVILVAGGTLAPGGTKAWLKVTNVSPGTGAITSGQFTGIPLGIKIIAPGAYSVVPPNPVGQDTTNGTGTGATFNMTWKQTGAQYTQVGFRFVQKYGDADFTTLGLPLILG